MVLIEDGKGTGRKVAVNSAQQMNVHAITNPFLQFESEVNGNAYSWCSSAVTAASTTPVILVKNTASGLLHIDRIDLSAAATQVFNIGIPTAIITTLTGTTTITGFNFNTGSGNIAEASAITLCTNSEADTLTNIAVIHLGAASTSGNYILDVRGLFIDKNQAIAITGTQAVSSSVTVYGHYIKNPEE